MFWPCAGSRELGRGCYGAILFMRASSDLFQELSIFGPITVPLDGASDRKAGVLEISQGEMSFGQQVKCFGFQGRLLQGALQMSQGLRRLIFLQGDEREIVKSAFVFWVQAERDFVERLRFGAFPLRQP